MHITGSFFRRYCRINFAAEGDGGTPPAKSFTQAELDAALEEERKKYDGFDDLKKAKKELDELKASQLTESEKLTKELEAERAKGAESAAKVKAMELAQLKTKLLAEEKLPADVADRVRGETEEEIKADIKKLKPLLAPDRSLGGRGTPKGGGEDEGPGDYGKSLAKKMSAGNEKARELAKSFFKHS